MLDVLAAIEVSTAYAMRSKVINIYTFNIRLGTILPHYHKYGSLYESYNKAFHRWILIDSIKKGRK